MLQYQWLGILPRNPVKSVLHTQHPPYLSPRTTPINAQRVGPILPPLYPQLLATKEVTSRHTVGIAMDGGNVIEEGWTGRACPCPARISSQKRPFSRSMCFGFGGMSFFLDFLGAPWHPLSSKNWLECLEVNKTGIPNSRSTR